MLSSRFSSPKISRERSLIGTEEKVPRRRSRKSLMGRSADNCDGLNSGQNPSSGAQVTSAWLTETLERGELFSESQVARAGEPACAQRPVDRALRLDETLGSYVDIGDKL